MKVDTNAGTHTTPRRLSLVRRVLAPLNLALIVVLGLFIVWDYNRTWRSYFDLTRGELQEEAKFVLSAVLRLRKENVPALDRFVDELCATMEEARSPGHAIVVRTDEKSSRQRGYHHGAPEIMAAMAQAVQDASGLARVGKDSILVGLAADEGVIVYVSHQVSVMTDILRPQLSRRMAGILALGLVLGIVLNIVLHRFLVRPLSGMVNVVHQFAQGQRAARMSDSPTAELGVLSDEFNFMASQLEMAELRRGGRMKRARRIQKNLLPNLSSLPDGRWVSVFQPADEVGGDYYDVFPLPDGSLLLCVADVAGHGVPGAMVAAMLKILLQAGVKAEQEPSALLEMLNAALCRTVLSEGFATMFLARLDLSAGSLTFTSAGHEPAYFIPANGHARCLEATGMVLGVAENAKWTAERLRADSGDRLVVVTDGIAQTTSPSGEMFGKDRLMKILEEGRSEALEDLRDRLVAAIDSHRSGAVQTDDITLLGVEF